MTPTAVTSVCCLFLAAILVACAGDPAEPWMASSETTASAVESTTAVSSSFEEDPSSGPPTTADASTSTAGETTGDPACASLRTEIETIAAGYRESLGLVGLAVGVTADSCEPWSQAWGDADIAAGAALAPEHLLRAGSVTKSFTAALVLKLAEEGLLTLDDTLALWGFAVPGADAITVRHLLHHTSGLADYQNNDAFRAAIVTDPARVWSPQELVDYAVALPPVGVPGGAHAYSNANYILAAMVAEAAAGLAYAEALRTRVLAPAGLSHTFVEGDELWPDPNAIGHVVVDGGPPIDTTGFFHASQLWSAGAVVSTVGDLRDWMTLLLGDEFLDPDSRAALVDLVPAAGTDGYGLGVFAVPTPNGPIYGHNGLVMGFQAAVFCDPETNTTVAVMSNQLDLDAQGAPLHEPTPLVLDIVDAIPVR